jgi:hypothetical protein
MTKVTWEPADAGSGLPPRLEKLKAEVVNQSDRTSRGFMHRLASVWVGRRGRDYLVLQCERKIDQHRVLATCTSSAAAYLLRGQLEALQRLTEEAEGRDKPMVKGARNLARSAGLLLPIRGR